MQSWIGDGQTLHCNVLNSENPLKLNKTDTEIVQSTNRAMTLVNGRSSVTPFNFFRNIKGNTQLEGTKLILERISSSINTDGDKD